MDNFPYSATGVPTMKETWRSTFEDFAAAEWNSTGNDTALPAYWREPVSSQMKANALGALISSAVSLIAATIVIVVYTYAMFKRNSVVAPIVTPHNHFIYLGMCLSLFTSMTFLLTSALRLVDQPEFSYCWCDTSMLLLQIFSTAQVLLELSFVLSVGVSTYRPEWLTTDTSVDAPPFVFHATCMSIGVPIVAAFCCAVGIRQTPEWGSRGDPTLQPWCWIPSTNPEGVKDPALFVAKFFSFILWVCLLPIVGFCSIAAAWKRLPPETKREKVFLFTRGFYTFVYSAMWIGPLVSRSLSNEVDSGVHLAQAISEPAIPLVTALVFFGTEVLARVVHVERRLEPQEGDALNTELLAMSPEQGSFGMTGIMRVLDGVHREHRQQIAAPGTVVVNWDELTQAWTIQVREVTAGPAGTASAGPTAQEVLDKVKQLSFVSMARWKLAALLAFMAGFGDVVCVLLISFFTAHITGNLLILGVAVSGSKYSEPQFFTMLMRHTWGLLVYFVGICCANEIIRRFNATVGARILLVVQAICFLFAYIGSRLSPNIGSPKWDASSASWISSYLMVIAFTMTNAFQRSYLIGLPICTLQTGNTTAVATDLMVLTFNRPQDRSELMALLVKMRNTSLNVFMFFAGVVCCTLAYEHEKPTAPSANTDLLFAVPAMLSFLALWLGWGSVPQ